MNAEGRRKEEGGKLIAAMEDKRLQILLLMVKYIRVKG
jgi:hypothetical protein